MSGFCVCVCVCFEREGEGGNLKENPINPKCTIDETSKSQRT